MTGPRYQQLQGTAGAEGVPSDFENAANKANHNKKGSKFSVNSKGAGDGYHPMPAIQPNDSSRKSLINNPFAQQPYNNMANQHSESDDGEEREDSEMSPAQLAEDYESPPAFVQKSPF